MGAQRTAASLTEGEMKRAAESQSGFTEEGDRDRPLTPNTRPRSRGTPWVLILVLPALIVALVIGLEIFGLLVRLFGA